MAVSNLDRFPIGNGAVLWKKKIVLLARQRHFHISIVNPTRACKNKKVSDIVSYFAKFSMGRIDRIVFTFHRHGISIQIMVVPHCLSRDNLELHTLWEPLKKLNHGSKSFFYYYYYYYLN